MKVGEVMTPDVEVVAPGDTLKAAAQLMSDLGLEALPVGDDNRLVGTISGCDIALRVVAEGRDAEKITVRQAMSADVLYCFENESAQIVSEKMGGWWVRRLPVVSSDKRLLGTVSLGDLTPLKAQRKTKRVSLRRRAKPAAGGRRSVGVAAA
jgi:CBS domain-containing protein